VEIFFVKSKDVFLVPACKAVSLPALPCSVLLHGFAQNSHAKGSDRYPTLLAGLTDGTLASFAFKDNELRDQKIISLGDTPVNMAACAGIVGELCLCVAAERLSYSGIR
jgi:DNA damage-binding protein 1